MTKRFEYHELASQFPLMSDLEYEALRQDIANNGLNEPLILFEGKILDGRNRYRACLLHESYNMVFYSSEPV